MAIIKIVSARAGEHIKVEEMENSLEDMQRFVGGYIQAVRVRGSLILWCNEEAKLQETNEFNIALVHNGEVYDYILGDAFFTSTNLEGEAVSVSQEELAYIGRKMKHATLDYDKSLIKHLEM